MLRLVLNPKYKSLRLIFCFISHEQGVVIIEEYDRRSLFLTLKCCHHLHPLLKGEASFLERSEEYLDIFVIVASTSEPMKDLVN